MKNHVCALLLALGIAGVLASGSVDWVDASPLATKLALQNGWTNAPYGTRNAEATVVSGIVYLHGAIANGTSPVAFPLPPALRPATNVYVPVDLCNATKGRLLIQPSGVVSIEAEGGAFANAQCFTSLEGASFAPSEVGFTALALANGWTHAPYGTSSASVLKIDGIVHLKGAIAGGTSSEIATLASDLRPATWVYVPVNLCDAAKGRLVIQPSGVVSVEAKGGFSKAQCFTSLDGVSFAQDATAFTTLSLANGWTHAPYGTRSAAVKNLGGVVQFEGAIAGGTSSVAFTLPPALRPATNVYVPVDLCNATKGRLLIQPSGVVSIQAEGGAFANAQCFTSLEGATFVVDDVGQSQQPLTVGVLPISITINAIDDKSVITTTTEVTRIDNKGSCEYRLEFMAPGDKTRGINEIGGNRPGGAQRINSCTGPPPAFAATPTSNAAWFDEQSTYYWAKKSRDYAKAALWITPPGWNGGPFTLGNAEVSLSVLTVGDAAGGFTLACHPRGQESAGCMRYWPGQNPKIYIQAGRAVPSVVVHEYGHYAAGYVFGHQDTLGSGGFKIDNCVHRAFQEGIAETFEQLFVHHELTSAGITKPLINIAGKNSQWRNDCGPGEYAMSNPLWEAFAQAVWGTGRNAAGTPIAVPWPNAASANRGMMNAFTFALIKTRDFRMHDFAVTALNYIDTHQAPNIATVIRAIFASHGLTLAANGKQCIENQECASNYCDNGDGTSKTRLCMPAARTGRDTDPCTHDNQCASNLCFGLTRDAAGNWVPGTCGAPRPLGASCNNNAQCQSTYCDAGFNTANTNKCMPRGGTGQGSDPCTHDSQCASNSCAGLTRDANGNWVPGNCVAQGALGASCNNNAQCRSTYCDAGFNTANINKCMPRGGTGGGGDPCTHNSQCASSNCNGLTQVNGVWQPGRCQ